MTVLERIQQLQQALEQIIQGLSAEVLALPDNPQIRRVAPGCFTMAAADLLGSGHWDPRYHDFRYQYQQVVKALQGHEPTATLRKFREILGQQRVYVPEEGWTSLHPTVVANLQRLFGTPAKANPCPTP